MLGQLSCGIIIASVISWTEVFHATLREEERLIIAILGFVLCITAVIVYYLFCRESLLKDSDKKNWEKGLAHLMNIWFALALFIPGIILIAKSLGFVMK